MPFNSAQSENVCNRWPLIKDPRVRAVIYEHNFSVAHAERCTFCLAHYHGIGGRRTEIIDTMGWK